MGLQSARVTICSAKEYERVGRGRAGEMGVSWETTLHRIDLPLEGIIHGSAPKPVRNSGIKPIDGTQYHPISKYLPRMFAVERKKTKNVVEGWTKDTERGDRTEKRRNKGTEAERGEMRIRRRGREKETGRVVEEEDRRAHRTDARSSISRREQRESQ